MNRLAGAAFLIALVLPAAAQDTMEPHLSYCYPAGGQRGTTVQVLAGGMRLNGPRDVLVSGDGVRAVVVRSLGRMAQLNGEERQAVVLRLNEVREWRKQPAGRAALGPKPEGIPDHPLLNNIDNLSRLEEDFLVCEFLMRDNRRQLYAQLSETVLLEITIDAGATPGDRELRVRTQQLGLTNPMVFQVGGAPEVLEDKPGDSGAAAVAAVDVPAALNGQIRPGDRDRFRFRATQGQGLVIQAQARQLIPFLADAVPGWFQATLALLDANGRELEFVDDWRFEPDPVLFFRVPRTGEYQLEIRDALYRGREDFVYRIRIAEQPFVTDIFPLGGRVGEETVVNVRGWNLPGEQLALDTAAEGGAIRRAVMRHGDLASNAIPYAVDTLPESLEAEPNDDAGRAQAVVLPIVLNGRIDAPGDEEVFRFQGRAGVEVVIEVLARRLRSPMDSVVWLTDAAGKVVAWNDDSERTEGFLRTEPGDVTHHADSYVRAKLPQDGLYFVRLADAQRQGGVPWRLRLSAPRPDFILSVTPSAINMRGGIAMPLEVHALRLDGFDGPIALSLKDSPAGFSLQGAAIPAGRDSIVITLTPPLRPADEPVPLHLQGSARIGTRTVVRDASPCEDAMQAFLWRHLMPGAELLAVNLGGRRIPAPEITGGLPVRIPRGGTVEIFVRTPALVLVESIELQLENAPAGLTLVKTTLSRDGLKLELKAEADGPAVGFEGNLIVGAYTYWGPKGAEAKGKAKKRIAVGVLPAVPFKVVSERP
ncbi:MAG: hypothetical protein HYY18_10110 [Planctomycetes bacterium]|nr:hypothetical protein [Planctomycetota bacterium]